MSGDQDGGSMTKPVKTGIVLSGGGARGAYEVGVIAGLVEVLGLGPEDDAPFQVYTGTSVGAINVSFLAANAQRGDMGTRQLIEVWSQLNLAAHFRLDLFGLSDLKQRMLGRQRRLGGRALLDADALEDMVESAIPWDRLHSNIRTGVVDSLVVTALRVYDGQTTLFVESAPDRAFKPSRDPRRTATETRITSDTVLASAAIPFVFPIRSISGQWYCDGSLRFNTPIAPAIRGGAEKLVVISLLHRTSTGPDPSLTAPYPSPVTLLGKVLNALLLDPVNYDLQVLRRLNRILDVLDEAIDESARGEVDRVTIDTRGMPYQQLDTLVFSPSHDLGEVAGQHLRQMGPRRGLGRVGDWFLRRAARESATWELDLASYVLFDGDYAARLIEIGRSDAHQRADEIRAFFES
ncbi:MAG: hypothetical protein CMH52_07565 [Myxococcales bacterium]|nr:hypothetical protein [Myxococcales bacterium]